MRNTLNWMFLAICISFVLNPLDVSARKTKYFPIYFDVNSAPAPKSVWMAPLACPNPPVIASIDLTNTSCGSNVGAVTINMVGNATDFTYAWSNLATTNTLSNLYAGFYRVTITDPSTPDCSIDTFVIVQNTDGPTASLSGIVPTTCEAANGQATLLPATYNYQWDDLVGSNTRNNLSNRTYSVTVTDPATSCYGVMTVNVGSTNPLGTTVSITEPATCNQSNGSAAADVTGGTGDYSYSWGTMSSTTTLPPGDYVLTVTDNGNGCIDSVAFMMLNANSIGTIELTSVNPASCNGGSDGEAIFTTTEGFPFGEPSSILIKDFGGLPRNNGFLTAGSYMAYLLDAGGCIADSTQVQMTENTSLNAVANVIAQTCTVGGIVTLDVTGGVPPYTYDWGDLAGTDDPKDRTNLVDGNYSVTVHDDLGCQFVLGVNVGNECGTGACTNPVIITDVVIGQSVCGLSNGSAKVLINGNPTDYLWEWSPQVGVLIAPGNERQSLGLGTYSVTITDKLNNACFTSKSFAVTNSNGPQATVTSTTPVACNSTNGGATLSPASLTYTWADGSHLAERTDLADGYHFVTVTDGSCDNIVTVYIKDTKTLDASYTVNNQPTCGQSDGSVTITANGSGSYSYDWGSGATNNGMASGNYAVLVSDLVTGCDTVLNIILNDEIPGASVTINGDVFTSCAGSNDGMVDFTVDYFSGFAAPATIVIWNHADSVVTNGALFVGPHCVVVKDANGCIAGQACFFVNSPLALNVFSSVTPVTCTGQGAIDLTVTGGDGGYTYDWADVPGTDDPEDRMGIGSGTYSITVTDGHGCTAIQDFINVADICGCDAFAGTLTVDSTDICDQKPNMLISAVPDGNAVVPSGYVQKYFLTKFADNIVYKISDSPVISVAGSARFIIHSFVYDPAVFDVATIELGTTTIFEVNNQLIQGGGLICASLDMVGAEVLVNKCTVCNLPQPTASVVDAHCGFMDGSIQLAFSQDTTGFVYKWSPNVGNTSSISNIEAGAYYVTVSEYGDATCSISKTVVVTNVDGPVVTIDSIAPTICTSASGFLRLSPPTLDYLWENGSESYVRSSLTDTLYAIKVTNPSTGCFSMLGIEIQKEDPLVASLEIISQPVCGLNNGHAKVNVEGGSGTYTYSWGNFQEKQDLLPGQYTVVVADTEYGCHDVLPFTMVDEAKNLIVPDSLFIESGICPDAYPLCLDLPASNAFGYTFSDNGLNYTGSIVACGTDTLYYYDAMEFQIGSYTVIGKFNGVSYTAPVITSQVQMLDSLKAWDPFSGWKLSNDRFIAQTPQANYEDLFLTETNLGLVSFVKIQVEAVEQGIQLKFDPGTHDIFIRENATGCLDTLFAQIDCITCLPTYTGSDTIFGGICGVDTGFLCLDIPPSEIANYTIRDNWNPYDGAYSACANDQTEIALSQGGHTLIVTNNETYCSDTLQLFVYCVPPPDFIIDTFLYENDFVNICLDNSLLQGTPIFSQELCQILGQPKVSNEIDYSTFCVNIGGLKIGRDTLCIQVCDDQSECTMTYIYVDILPRIDTVNTFVTLTTTDTFCIDTTLLTGNLVSVDNLCPNLSGPIVDVNILGLTGCIEMTGMNIGVDTVCLAVCDSYNHCDTTIIIMESDVPKPDTMDIEMIIYSDTMICVDFSDLPRPVESFDIICQDDPGKALFQVSMSSYCVEINAYDYGTDSLCFAFCDDQFCDTLVLAVNIIQDTTAVPVANDDSEFGVLNRPVDLYPLDNDLVNGVVDSMAILLKPVNGTVVINPDFSFTYTPNSNICEVVDSFTYALFNKNGTDNAVVKIDILCDEVTVYSALSPNGDGINDFLYIQDIDDYPNNHVIVYNRWGNVVFDREGYTNSDPWDGLWEEANLPVGTYYYVIVLAPSSLKTYSGYIQISR